MYVRTFLADTCIADGSATQVSSSWGGDPAIASNGTEYGIAWDYWNASTSATYLMFSRITAATAKVGSDTVVAQFLGGGGAPHPRIAWSPGRSEYGISSKQGYSGGGGDRVAFSRINSSGGLLGSQVVYGNESQATYDPLIVSAGQMWGLGWRENASGNRFMRIDGVGSNPVVLSIGGYSPYVAWDGTGFLYAYANTDLFTTPITCQ